MRLIVSPLAVAGSTIIDVPPLEAFAARTKSTWPPGPENGRRPNDSDAHWPKKSTARVPLMECRLSLRLAEAGALV